MKVKTNLKAGYATWMSPDGIIVIMM